MILKKMMVELAIGVLDKEVDKVAPPGDQICNQCKWRLLLAKFATNASGLRKIKIVQEVKIVKEMKIFKEVKIAQPSIPMFPSAINILRS